MKIRLQYSREVSSFNNKIRTLIIALSSNYSVASLVSKTEVSINLPDVMKAISLINKRFSSVQTITVVFKWFTFRHLRIILKVTRKGNQENSSLQSVSLNFLAGVWISRLQRFYKLYIKNAWKNVDPGKYCVQNMLLNLLVTSQWDREFIVL